MMIDANKLINISTNILVKNGIKKNDAKLISNIYVEADKCGIGTHGIKVLSSHIQKIKAGGYNLNPKFSVINKNTSFSLIDGDNSFGPLCAYHCMNLAVKEAII